MKILCFGDSNTHGYDPRSYFGSRYPAEHRWTDILAERTGWTVVNAGENGREIPRLEAQIHSFDQLLREQMPFDLLVIMLGSNDLLQGNSVETVCIRMEQFLKHVGKYPTLLIAPPPMKRGQWVFDEQLVHASREWSRCCEVLAKRDGIAFADAGKWDVPLAFDGVHFTEAGHHVFARELENILRGRNP